eukprot:COSAG05_NODE_286_length_12159_cov_63.200249_3_plen_220_part_00
MTTQGARCVRARHTHSQTRHSSIVEQEQQGTSVNLPHLATVVVTGAERVPGAVVPAVFRPPMPTLAQAEEHGVSVRLQAKGRGVDQHLHLARAAGGLPALRIHDALEVLLHPHLATAEQSGVELDGDRGGRHCTARECRPRHGPRLAVGADGGALSKAHSHLLLGAWMDLRRQNAPPPPPSYWYCYSSIIVLMVCTRSSSGVAVGGRRRRNVDVRTGPM